MASDPKTLSLKSSPAELANLSPEQQMALFAATKPIQGPVVNAGGAFVLQAGNDAVLVFNRPQPVFAPDGTIANLAIAETTAIIHLSLATLKDLHWAIGENIRIYEESHGEIVTDAMKLRAAAKK